VAKARAIPDLGQDDSYASAAARVVEVRARELVELAAGVLDTEDIEPLHDMRVATRRLRAGLEVFEPCFPAKPFKAALRDVKALADALGERRDRDVHIDALTEFAEAISGSDRPGVGSLIDRMRDEQAEANKALEPMVDELRLGSLTKRLDELAASARRLAAT
jgi:CHAD domain-containing protein